MRELLFRAWNIKTKCMVESYQGMITIMTEELKGLNKDYIIMQYIGFNDKDTKKIFEGDIVEIIKMIDLGTDNFNPDFQEEKIIIKIEYGNYGYNIYQIKDIVKIKIIGNIYENAELLKG